MVDFDDFDLGPQSDEFADDLSPNGEDFDGYDAGELPEHDDSFADELEVGADERDPYDSEYDGWASQWDDDPSPYDGTYSEM